MEADRRYGLGLAHPVMTLGIVMAAVALFVAPIFLMPINPEAAFWLWVAVCIVLAFTTGLLGVFIIIPIYMVILGIATSPLVASVSKVDGAHTTSANVLGITVIGGVIAVVALVPIGAFMNAVVSYRYDLSIMRERWPGVDFSGAQFEDKDYRDRWLGRVTAINGVWVPARVTQDQYTAADITREHNAEVRRIMLERYGAGRWLEEIGTQPLSVEHVVCEQAEFYSHIPEQHEVRLYRAPQRGDEDLCMVRLVNAHPEPDGTYRVYWERVPPTIWSAREAVAWGAGMKADEYRPRVQT